MSLDQTQNFVRATIASAVDSADNTIDVTDSNQLPDPAEGEYNLILWDVDTYPRPGQDPSVEVVRATALDDSTDTLSVDRGQENTAAADHPETAVLQLSPTAKMFADIDAKTSALSEDGQTFAGESVDVEQAAIAEQVCKIGPQSEQSISSGTFTQINVDGIILEDSDIFEINTSDQEIEILVAGRYSIGGHLTISTDDPSRDIFEVYINNDGRGRLLDIDSNRSTATHSVSDVFDLQEGDTLHFEAFSNGDDPSIFRGEEIDTNRTNISIVREG